MDLGREPESPWQDDHDVLLTDAGAVPAGDDGYIDNGIINDEVAPEIGVSREDAAATEHDDQRHGAERGMPPGDCSGVEKEDPWKPWFALFGPSLIHNLKWALHNRVSLSLDAIALALLTGHYVDHEDVPDSPAPD
jgi:hypothetical protein